MTYEETLSYLFSRLPMFSNIGKEAYKTDITNTVILCDSIDNPQDKFRSIHIAGTNGKGSTSHMLAAIFQESGYKTGLYTSPHLKDFRERIKVDGIMIPQDYVIDFVSRIKKITEQISPSFFEVTVAMAFEYFASEKVDIAIIETGLGGRLDSTNIIIPQLSVITNIGFDHMNILGNTLEEIAFEKAGIIKNNVPVVIGEFLPQTENIFIDKAIASKAPLISAEEEYEITDADLINTYLQVSLNKKSSGKTEIYRTDLTGLYQQKNIRTVITSINALIELDFNFEVENILNGLLNVKKLTGLHGRWEIIGNNPLVVLDVAHNEDGIKQLVEQIKMYKFNQLHIVFGMVKDKDVKSILSLLPKEAAYYFTNAHIARALPADLLLESAKARGLNGKTFDNVNNALKTAIDNAARQDMIVVCGSVFVVAEVALEPFEA
ncbi:MAG: folylpolyglutamate synthase/dihydrofolate synthase family protein [Ginsengibacter sp.]